MLFKYGNSKQKIQQHIPLLQSQDGKTVDSDFDKPNILNHYFVSLFTNDDNNLPAFDLQTEDMLASIIITPEIVCKAILKQGLGN